MTSGLEDEQKWTEEMVSTSAEEAGKEAPGTWKGVQAERGLVFTHELTRQQQCSASLGKVAPLLLGRWHALPG